MNHEPLSSEARARHVAQARSAEVAQPTEPLRLSHTIGYALYGQFGYLLAQMAVLAALAHLRGAEAVGEFGLALALTTPAFMFANMGGRSGQASDVSGRYSFSDYGGLMVTAALLATVVSIAAGFLLARTPGALLIVVIVALTKAFESISSLAYGAFHRAGRADKVAKSLVLRGAATVPPFVVLLAAGLPTGTAFLAQLLVWSVLALFYDYPAACRIANGRLVRPAIFNRRVVQLAREVWPLGASYLLNALLVSLPRLFVERSLGLSALGLLTVVNYFQQAGSMAVNAVTQALVSRFARLQRGGADMELKRQVTVLLALAVACSMIGLAFVYLAGEWLLRIAFGPAFVAAEDLLLVVTLALCAKLFSMAPQTLLHAHRKFMTFMLRELATVLCCTVLLVLLVPSHGLMGAGYAIVGTAFFRLVIMTLAVAVLLRKPSILTGEDDLRQGASA